MSGILCKGSHRLHDVPHAGFMGAFTAAGLAILTLLAVLAILGHFSPAR